jgi:hypothetical protein
MFFHFLLDEGDGFGGDVAAEVVEAGEVSQEGEEGVANGTSEFREVTDNLFVLMEFSEPGDLNHLPFKVSPVPEKVTLMKLVEFIPYLLGIGFGFMIIVFCELGVVLLEFFLELKFHLLGEFVEDDDLFGTAGLVELDFADLD